MLPTVSQIVVASEDVEGFYGLEDNARNLGKETLIDEIVGISGPIHEYMMMAHADAWTKVTLTMPQFKVLVAAAIHGRIDSPYLGRRLGMLPSTLTRIVDRLVERDLVRRRVDPRDRRVVYLEATEQGAILVRELTASTLPKAMNEAMHRLSTDDLQMVRQGMGILAAAVSHSQESSEKR